MDKKHILSKMTPKEKIKYCTGADSWHTVAYPHLGVSAFMVADGPHGLRCQCGGENNLTNINEALPATCFPTAVTAGATWDKELYALEGQAIGKEALAAGVSVVLGPGCNIKRSPLGGRSFEYLSEDPYFSGAMAAAFIQGQQSTGVDSCIKHFAVNSQEYKRQNGDSRIDERTLREIYLPAFEMAVKEGKVATVMCAYNKLNGTYCSDNAYLLTHVLRKEWGFEGLVMSDWGAMHDRIEAFKAGCDLNMPGGAKYMHKAALRALADGSLPLETVDASVERILRLAERHSTDPKPRADFDAHHELARKIACEGAVLLENNGALPAKAEDMVFIGHMAEHMRYQGAGSSHINPTKLQSLTNAAPDVPYSACCDRHGNLLPGGLEAAKKLARSHKCPVVAVGLPDSFESEAFDREHMGLPEGHNALVEAVTAENPNTVVVLFGGSPMELPWRHKVAAILYMGLPGQAGGQATFDLLTGAACPGGKLTQTWPERCCDMPCTDTFGQKDPEYREGIYVGYRYFDKAQKKVAYPFGYGLSYTSFAYSDLKLAGREVEVTVTNTGAAFGSEVVQLYVAAPQNGIHRPVQELKGFQKVYLAPGEGKTVRFTLDDRSFSVWHSGWKVPSGTYHIRIASSSRDIRLEETMEIAGEILAPELPGSWYDTMDGKPSRQEWEALMGQKIPVSPQPQKGSYTMENTCIEMKKTSLIMKILYLGLKAAMKLSYGRQDPLDPTYRMMLTTATDCPMFCMVICGGGAMPEWLAKLLVRIANGIFHKKTGA